MTKRQLSNILLASAVPFFVLLVVSLSWGEEPKKGKFTVEIVHSTYKAPDYALRVVLCPDGQMHDIDFHFFNLDQLKSHVKTMSPRDVSEPGVLVILFQDEEKTSVSVLQKLIGTIKEA